MATLLATNLLIQAKLVSDTNINGVGANGIGRMEKITAGQITAFVECYAAGHYRDSNITYIIGSFPITVVHHLTAWDSEATYTTDKMLADMESLMDPSFYDTVSGVYEVIAGPEMDAPERIGNCIEYRVTVQLAIEP